ncbi:MAG: DUF1353 domain-containing protein [Waterburya sp.]
MHAVWPVSPPRNGKAMEALTKPLVFDTGSEIIEVPVNFLSDGGSIPWWGRWFINPAHHRRAWIIHDWAWDTNRPDHAHLLDLALALDDCPILQRRVIVKAVSIFGSLKKRRALP